MKSQNAILDCEESSEEDSQNDEMHNTLPVIEIDKRGNLGQIFTDDETVQFMLNLRKNSQQPGSTLEPSSGNGAFSNKIPGCIAIEYDPDICPRDSDVLNMDFFGYPSTRKYKTQIANPPYVAGKKILPSTRKLINLRGTKNPHEKTNLYIYFFEKMIRDHTDGIGSEIILIIPRDFLKSTSAIPFNIWMYSIGTITHFYDHGDVKMFKNASPNTCILRYEVGNFSRKTITNDGYKTFTLSNGQLLFLNGKYTIPVSNIFDVKVGGVSGMDEIFVNPKGNAEFVFSETKTTGKTRKMFYNTKSPELERHKELLITRKIKPFTENNWWMWGRDFYQSTNKRIYVNCKTRRENPFFLHPCNNYDGAVIALFLKDQTQDPKFLCDALNNVNWEDLGFMCGNRYIFSQRTLESILLPETFSSKCSKSIQQEIMKKRLAELDAEEKLMRENGEFYSNYDDEDGIVTLNIWSK